MCKLYFISKLPRTICTYKFAPSEQLQKNTKRQKKTSFQKMQFFCRYKFSFIIYFLSFLKATQTKNSNFSLLSYLKYHNPFSTILSCKQISTINIRNKTNLILCHKIRYIFLIWIIEE